MKSFKETVKKIPGVVNIASSTAVPGRNNNNNGYMMEGRKDETFLMVTNWVDYDYLDTYGMTLGIRKIFNESYTTDKDACLINEMHSKEFEITDIDKDRFIQPGDSGRMHYLADNRCCKEFQF